MSSKPSSCENKNIGILSCLLWMYYVQDEKMLVTISQVKLEYLRKRIIK